MDINYKSMQENVTGVMNGLPEPVPFLQFDQEERVVPPEIIRGVLHKGHKMLLAGPSKSFKTWSFLDLCYCLAAGKSWWGFDVGEPKDGEPVEGMSYPSKVMYVNMELREHSLQKRMRFIVDHNSIDEDDLSLLYIWNLRGKVLDISQMVEHFVAHCTGFDAICIDPIYMLNVMDIETGQARDENSATGVAQIFRYLEEIANKTGAAIIIGHHFRKGGPGSDPMERASGSGVFLREPDSLFALSPHSEPDCFVVASRLRDFPQIDEFGLEFTFPTFKRNGELDVDDLKGRPGGKPKFNLQEFVALVPEGLTSSLTWTELKEKAKTELGMESGTTFDRWLKKALDQGRLKKSPSGDLLLRNK